MSVPETVQQHERIRAPGKTCIGMDTLSVLIVTSRFSKRDKLRDPETLASERRLQPSTKKFSLRDSGKVN